MVATSRALASQGPEPLLDDPFAAPLVRAVGLAPFVRILDGEVNLEDDPALNRRTRTEQMTVRTRFFDEFFISAAEAGVRQAVILASGLDTRAYRLPWPDGTTVYEIDQPAVIEFKTRTLADLGAEPTANRRTVPIDLRADWPAALRAAGLDTGAPTAWLAEGLLIYLPSEAQDRLFDNITALSVPGSAIATEYVPGLKDMDLERVREQTAQLRGRGLDIDMPSLVYAGERSHVIDYLRGKGWNVAGTSRADLFVSHGLTIPTPDNDDPLGEIIYVSGPLGS
jgi:methyltransferase (TIGR00027 family)